MADLTGVTTSNIQQTTQQTGAQTAQAQTGERRGEAVVLKPSAASLAADMQEEVGQLFSEKEERKAGSKRKVSNRAEDLQKKVEDVKKIQDYLEKVPDMRARRQDVERLARRMKDQSFKSDDDVLEYLKKGLEKDGEKPDATQLYAALNHIEKMLGEEGQSPELLKHVENVANQILAEHGKEIQKGAIVSESAALYTSETLGSASDLRNLYMEQVVEHKGVLGTFESILEKYGEDGFDDAVAFLLRAAGDDLATLPNGVDRDHQKHVMDNLYQLEVMNTVRERSDLAVDRIKALIGKEGGTVPDDFNSISVMKKLFAMVESPLNLTEVEVTNFCNDLLPEPVTVQTRINFLREFREVASLVPLKVFDATDTQQAGSNRQALLDVISEAQTVADDEEAELLED